MCQLNYNLTALINVTFYVALIQIAQVLNVFLVASPEILRVSRMTTTYRNLAAL
jgi:hypothetical protein